MRILRGRGQKEKFRVTGFTQPRTEQRSHTAPTQLRVIFLRSYCAWKARQRQEKTPLLQRKSSKPVYPRVSPHIQRGCEIERNTAEAKQTERETVRPLCTKTCKYGNIHSRKDTHEDIKTIFIFKKTTGVLERSC